MVYRSSRFRSRRSSNLPLILIGLLVVVGLFAHPVAYYGSSDTVTFTVEEKERIAGTADSSGYYLIFTDRGVYKISNVLLYGRFNGSDMYGQLKVGEQYTGKIAGWRLGFFSMYPDLVEILPE